MISATLDYAAKLQACSPSWELFFREVLGLAGAISTEFEDHESRLEFEKTDDYGEVVKMFVDTLDHGPKVPNAGTKEIVIRVPVSVHEWMQDRAKREGFHSLTKYALHKLMVGSLEPNNGWNGKSRGLTNANSTAGTA